MSLFGQSLSTGSPLLPERTLYSGRAFLPEALFCQRERGNCCENIRSRFFKKSSFAHELSLGCPSKLVLIRNNRNWNRNLFRHYPKHNVCFGCFASIPKQRVSMFRLNRNKQKTNRNSLTGSIFCHFLQKIYVFFSFFLSFSVFFRFFWFVSKQFVLMFQLFRFYTETESFD
jgi:hypothetical protein